MPLSGLFDKKKILKNKRMYNSRADHALFEFRNHTWSISRAITFFARSSNFTVKLPVPEPTSNTVSVDLIADCKYFTL
ncbi:unnamed protein product [Gongylonema pulchrum]|uniref:Uncharacterized protein n=1 Tax=Gongylonema pulchrum TaxID=637853 RepID=A0A183EV61_9BILA|nr:unnamed protein product [Gongylonema pulchrum]